MHETFGNDEFSTVCVFEIDIRIKMIIIIIIGELSIIKFFIYFLNCTTLSCGLYFNIAYDFLLVTILHFKFVKRLFKIYVLSIYDEWRIII